MTKTESMCVTLISGPIAAEQRGAGPFEKHRKTFGGTRKRRTEPLHEMAGLPRSVSLNDFSLFPCGTA
ncbi:hypothetical protein [Streptomyces niveus]|uniref:FXSXX-COOH protein n=1 Tax=Streptomyces niveus TaxID=193462 RepID=A0ABZ2ACM1_STRNV|nr:hypothetical protein [Streptomyces niveus]